MKLTVTIPEIIVTIETKTGTLPAGTMMQLSVPVRDLVITPIPETQPIPIPEPTPTPIPVPEPEPEPIHTPRFERNYFDPTFRSTQKNFENIGKATDLGLSDSNWTIVLNVRFTDFSKHQRVIGSATASGAGSSLQIGILGGGILWVDTFHGGMTAGQLELNRWYEIAVSHNRVGQEKIYVDKKLVSAGNVPVFKSNSDVYVGRWVNEYYDFDLWKIRIYPLLSDEEIASL
jgi:hypothetical protein